MGKKTARAVLHSLVLNVFIFTNRTQETHLDRKSNDLKMRISENCMTFFEDRANNLPDFCQWTTADKDYQ